MADITLFELNLEGSTFNAPFAGEAEEEADEEAEYEEESSGRGKGAALGALAGLAFLVVVALVAKRRLGGSDDEFEEESPGATVTLDAE